MSSETVVREFLTGWGTTMETLRAAFLDYLAPNIEWEQSGIPTVTSAQQAVDFLAAYASAVGLAGMEVEIDHVAAAGDVVLVERVDYLRRGDGSLIARVPVVGVFEVGAEARITRWREYFDPTELLALAPPAEAAQPSSGENP
jgi:limonene-1,2-epoxide hydrolase